MKTMKITLNKANKLKDKLKQEMNSYFSETGSSRYSYLSSNSDNNLGIVSVKIPLALETKKSMTLFKNTLEESKKRYDLALNLKNDYYSVKDALFKANANMSISHKLDLMDYYKGLIKVHKDIKDNRSNLFPDDITGEYITESTRILKDSDQKNDLIITVKLFSNKVLEGKIKEYQEQINRLEDEIISLNTNNHIEVRLHDDVAGLLGF